MSTTTILITLLGVWLTLSLLLNVFLSVALRKANDNVEEGNGYMRDLNERVVDQLIAMRKQGWDTIPDTEVDEPYLIDDEYEEQVEAQRLEMINRLKNNGGS
jgi:hypothetical protein